MAELIDLFSERANERTIEDRQLQAALLDLPLPVGFMHRMRQLVQSELDSAE